VKAAGAHRIVLSLVRGGDAVVRQRSVIDGEALVVLVGGRVVLKHWRGKASKASSKKKGEEDRSLELTKREVGGSGSSWIPAVLVTLWSAGEDRESLVSVGGAVRDVGRRNQAREGKGSMVVTGSLYRCRDDMENGRGWVQLGG
jgi:hypothetical protein